MPEFERKPGGGSLVQDPHSMRGPGTLDPGKRTLTEQVSFGAPAVPKAAVQAKAAGTTTDSPDATSSLEPAATAAGSPESTADSATSPTAAARHVGTEAPGVAGPASNGPSPSPKADVTKDGPLMPAGHEGHKVKIEIGHGSVTGAITLSIDIGKTGVPLPDHLKVLKNTLSVKLNGFISKLETVMLNGNLDAEVLDGVKVAVDVSVLKLSSDKVKPDDSVAALDLLTVALKLQGDVGHWVDVGPNVKVTLEGQVQMALGGKLAAQFAKYTAAQLDRMMLAKETEVVGEAIAGHVQEIERIESQLTKLRVNPSAARREIQALEQELFRHRIQVSTGNQQLKGLARRLGEAKGRVRAALGRIEGKFAKKIAWAMEKKAVKQVAKCLAKLMPILNVVSTVADVIEVIKLVRDLIKHHGKMEIGGGDDSSSDSAASGGEEASADAKSGDPAASGGAEGSADAKGSDLGAHEGENGGQAPGAARASTGASPSNTSASWPDEGSSDTGVASTTGAASKADPRSLEAAQRGLSPNAQIVIAAVTHKDGGHGPVLDADQLRMAGLLVSPDLGPDQVREVISTLRSTSSVARTAEEAIIAIDQAVRAVRNKSRTVTVDGVARPDLAQSSDSDGLASAGEGPVTSPSQVDANRDEAFIIVHEAPPAVIGRWFRADERDLVLTDEGARWQSTHLHRVVGGERLMRVVPAISSRGENCWDLQLRFELQPTGQGIRAVTHRFLVERGEASSLGAQVGELAFEPYIMVLSGP